MHSEFENKKLNIQDIQNKISKKYVNYNHFADSKSSIDSKYDNEFNLETVNLDALPKYIRFNVDKYKKWIVS